MFLAGLRDTPAEPFRYLRVPADDQDSLDGLLRLRAALADPALREQAVRALRGAWRTDADAARAGGAAGGLGRARAGAVRRRRAAGADGEAAPRGPAGDVATSSKPTCREAERERAGEVLLRILNGALFELAQLDARAAPA